MPRKAGKTTAKFDGTVKDYPTKYLRCRGRKRHPWKVKSDFNIVYRSNGTILQFEQLLHCTNCPVVRTEKYEVRDGRFIRLGKPTLDYSGAPGYLMDPESEGINGDDALDELLMRDMMSQFNPQQLEALFKTRPEFQAPKTTTRHLRAV
jgi:hypothetical protein